MKKLFLNLFFIIIAGLIVIIGVNYNKIYHFFFNENLTISQAKKTSSNTDFISFLRSSIERKNRFVDFNNSDVEFKFFVDDKKLDSITSQVLDLNFSLQFSNDSFIFSKSEILTSDIIFHFWASWCDPCVNELPELISFLKKNQQSIIDKKLIIILVSFDFDSASITNFLKSFPELNNNSYIQIWDKDQFFQNFFQIDKLPSTYVFSQNGKIKKYHTVVDWKNFIIR